MSRPSSTAVADLAALLQRGRVLVLTGAGISTDSGIPDYRDAEGRSRHRRPMTFQQFVGSAEARRRYWARSQRGWPRVAGARPNTAHRAVTAMQRAGALSGVVTQNVDGLHTAADSHGVLELHGRLDTVVCLGCGRRRPRTEIGLRLQAVNPGFAVDPGSVGASGDSDRPDGDVVLADEEVRDFRLVACRACEGLLKPDVVFFGEPVPRQRFAEALGRVADARALLVLGSSLMVGSAYRLVTAARREGLPVAVVTRGVTRADHLVDLRIDADLAPTVTEVLARTPGPAGPSAGTPTDTPATPPARAAPATPATQPA